MFDAFASLVPFKWNQCKFQSAFVSIYISIAISVAPISQRVFVSLWVLTNLCHKWEKRLHGKNHKNKSCDCLKWDQTQWCFTTFKEKPFCLFFFWWRHKSRIASYSILDTRIWHIIVIFFCACYCFCWIWNGVQITRVPKFKHWI